MTTTMEQGLVLPSVQAGNVKVEGNTISSEDTDGAINLSPNGSGSLNLRDVTWPETAGTNGQVLYIDGSGQAYWGDAGGGGGGGGSNPIGSITSFAQTSAPVGYLVCDGSAISRATYIDLFSTIGTTWGVGDGSTTFNLPDLQRRVAVGSGGTGTGTLGNAVGDTGGAETVTLADGNMPSGTPVNAGTSSGINVVSNSGAASYVPQSSNPYSNGSATPVNNLQPSAVVLICIKSSADASIASGGNIGDFVDFGGTTPPSGCLVRDGSAVSRTTYAALFTVIGTTYGVGDGSTTFNLPDSQRRVSVGAGGSGTGTLGNAVGDTGGAESVLLTSVNLPTGTPYNASGTGNQGAAAGGAFNAPANNSAGYSSGGNTAHNNMQPSLVVLPCIRYEGVAATVAVTASQSQMEAASSSDVFSAPSVQQFHPGHPKAWVQYNQSGNTIGSSYNVTSVTDSSPGNFTVNWDIDFSSINYCATASTDTAGGGNNLIGIGQNGAKTVGSTLFTTIQVSSALDRTHNNVAAFGDQA